MGMADRPTMFVCRGCKGRAALVDQLCAHARSGGPLEGHLEIRFVRCQKICHGPVVGVPVDGRVEWFERMRKPKRVAALAKMVGRGKHRVPDRLRGVWLKQRSGRPPR
jgi:hypothetical protein